MKVICLTGGLASGKSTAVRYLADKGAAVIDADILGHRVYDPGTDAFEAVINTFGEETRGEDGQINRKVLGTKVFGKPDELKKLTDIVWPEIRGLAEQEIASMARSNPDAVIILEAAVLFEAGWEDIGEEIWVVVTNRETAIERSMARDGATRDAVESRLDAQLTNDERTTKADVVITNNSTQQEMYLQLDAAWTSSTGR